MNGRGWRVFVVCVCVAGATAMHVAAALAAPLVATPLPAPLGSEIEPNNVPAEATPILGDMRIRASLSPAGDVDYYRFEAQAGDRVFAAVITAASGVSGVSAADSKLTLLGSDGTTVIEEDDNGGSLLRSSSSIAGAKITSAGTYYLRIEDTRGLAATPAPYDLYLALRSGAPAAEVEPNNEFTEANPLVNGEVTGTHEPGAGHKDWFSITLQAGDTVFLSLDLDPERNGGSFDGQLGFGLAGDTDKAPAILTVDDPQSGETPDSMPSESLAMTVSKAGTYYAYVDVASTKVDTGGPEATYDLAVTAFPRVQPSCRTYSASPTGALLDGGTTTFPIQVGEAAQVLRAALRLDLEETVMADLDVSLRSPAGLEVPLFSDIGETSASPTGQRHLEAIFDDFAALPPLYSALRPLGLQPDSALSAFAAQQTEGTWSLVIKDDTPNGSAGNLAAAELVLCPVTQTSATTGAAEGTGTPATKAETKPAAPAITGFVVGPSKFRAAKAGATVLAARPKSGGTLVSYEDSAAALTNFVLFALEPGRRSGAKCVRETAANSAKRACTRLVKVTSFVRQDVAGRNRFGLSGRVSDRALPPGPYQLQATAYAAAGLTSAVAKASFKVLPPAPQASSSRG